MVLRGTVVQNGMPVTHWFEYGPTGAYGSTTEPIDAAGGPAVSDVSSIVSRRWLGPNTTVHYRLVVSSGAGTSYGSDMTVTTGPPGYADLVFSTGGLLGYWRLGESAGATAADSTGSLPGTYAGAPRLGVGGALAGGNDGSAGFDGAGTFVDVPDHPSLRPSGQFAVEGWFEVDAGAGGGQDRYIASKTTWPYGHALYVDGAGRLVAAVVSPDAWLEVMTPDAVSSGAWHHAAASFDGKTLTLYLDGVRVARASATAAFSVPTGASPFRIGAHPAGAAFWHGRIDEVAFYGAALAAGSVADHYRGGDGRPAAQTSRPSATGATAADLTARVAAHGQPTTYHFEWGPTAGYGERTVDANAGAGATAQTVSAPLAGLTEGARYHYRVVATNASGTRVGADRSFVAGRYSNELTDTDAADPMVLRTSAGYFAYTTGTHFPVLRSDDLVNWTPAGTAFLPETAPGWVSGDWWAPTVHAAETTSARGCPGFELAAGSQCYFLYYVGTNARNEHCIGVATSDRPDGGFVDHGILRAADATHETGGRAIGCGDASGYGNIDPDVFVDSDGRAYLYVSIDFACAPGCWLRPTVSVIPLTADLTRAAGGRTPLFSGDAGTWEHHDLIAPTVEAPFMVKRGSRYFLFYSGGSWRSAYGMGVAVGDSPMGPFARSSANPILASAAGADGAGGGSIVEGPLTGGDQLVYHARSRPSDHPRTLRVDRLVWNDANDAVAVHGPTTTPQPLP